MNNSLLQGAEARDEAHINNPVLNHNATTGNSGESMEASVEDTVEAGADTQLRELQVLLFGNEQRQLDRLQAEWNNPAALTPKVSSVLPDAIAQRSGEDYQLTQAMTPYVVESIKNAARHNPEYISEAIFPILGPAIRKAIAQAFNNLTQTINQTLQHSFSVRGLRWRMEAMASGKSFGEVVLYHSLLYRVEQIFLIHSETGLVLVHATAAAVEAQDADIVSGMLTAIQDFVKDSFGAGAGEGVEVMQVGDVNVLVEQGPRAVLACVIRGSVPTELRQELQETLERIHRERGTLLEAFDGDATFFENCRPLLENHLQSRYQSDAEPGQAKLPKPVLIAGIILLGALLVWGGFLIRDRLRWNRYLDKVQATPGLVITETETGWRKYSISGLRDPLATNPATLLAEESLNPSKVKSNWEEFHSPELAEVRVKKLLNPPTGVTLQVRDGILLVGGAVSQQWISEVKKFAPFITGINQVELNAAGEIALLQKEIASQTIRYVGIQPAPAQEQLIESVMKKIQRLDEVAQAAGKKVTIRIIGHTDPSGTSEMNEALSLNRAQQMERILRERGGKLNATSFVTVDARDKESQTNVKEENRCVTFQVEFGS